MWVKSHRLAGNILKGLAAWSLILMAAAAENTTSPALEPIRNETTSSPGYTWSPWGRWSPCSRTCGGGISVQKRICVPRNVTAEPLSSRPDRPAAECSGFSQRYHECNTAPCPGEQKDPRAEQCSSYDRRPFRGRFYNWVPYVDGDSPCTLNCRPMGHQFYASLGLVADGTPCTKPGYRSVCVEGTCKVTKWVPSELQNIIEKRTDARVTIGDSKCFANSHKTEKRRPTIEPKKLKQTTVVEWNVKCVFVFNCEVVNILHEAINQAGAKMPREQTWKMK